MADSKALVPVDFSFRSEKLPAQQTEPLAKGINQGVWFTFDPEQLDFLVGKMNAWFDDDDTVIMVDYGVTDKQERGCIVMEWDGCAINPLFIKLLKTEEMIEEYCVYEVQV